MAKAAELEKAALAGRTPAQARLQAEALLKRIDDTADELNPLKLGSGRAAVVGRRDRRPDR